MREDPCDDSRVSHRPGRRRWGIAVRWAIVCAWAALYAHHGADHVIRALGLVAERDIASVLDEHLGHRYRYRLLDPAGGNVGDVFLEYRFADGSYLGEVDLRLDRIDRLPGIAPVLGLLPASTGRGIAVTATTHLDDRYRLHALSAEGRVFGIEGRFDATVDRVHGLRGTLVAPERGIRRAVHLPDFFADSDAGAAGLDIAFALPPGLQPGDEFSTQVLGIQPLPPDIVRRRIHYRVAETVPDPRGPDGPPLNRIEIIDAGRAVGDLTADRRGVIRRMRHAGSGLQLRLRSAFSGSERIWPPRDQEIDEHAGD